MGKTKQGKKQDPLRSFDAEKAENSEVVELAWAEKAFQFAEAYYKMIEAYPDPATYPLVPLDDELYDKFRGEFKDLRVDVVNEDELKSEEGKAKWRPFMMQFDKRVDDFNYMSLCRVDASKPMSPDNSFLCPRVQFYCIELARNREGLNKPDADKAKQYPHRQCGSLECETEKEGTSLCSSCRYIYYCSRECQLVHWKTHKRLCKQMKAERLAKFPPEVTSDGVIDTASYYKRVQAAFASRDVTQLARLFSTKVTEPMTHAEILAWGEDMFKEEDIQFHVDDVKVEQANDTSGVAVLTYHVTTKAGTKDFAGVERDWLRIGPDGKLIITKWVKLSE